MLRIRFRPEAEAEYNEAMHWYQEQKAGLEDEFMLCVDESLQRIRRNPQMYPIVYRHLRRAVVKRFPFVILYEVAEEELKVFSIFHSRRNPDSWQLR